MEAAATVCCAAASASVSRVKSGLAARSSGFSLQVASGSVDTTKKSTFSLYEGSTDFRPVWPYKRLCTGSRGEVISVPHWRPFSFVPHLCGTTAP